MATARQIEECLFRLAPREGAMDWDNVGLLVGDADREVRRVLVALDVTPAVAQEAIDGGYELIVAHHPVMNCTWHPVQSVRSDTYQGRLLIRLLRGGVSAICMHTNLDVAPGGVNDCLAEALELIDPGPLEDGEGLCRMGTLPTPLPLADFVRQVSHSLHCNGVRYADAGRPVSRVAVGGGACGEYIGAAIAAGCDTFVTSDLKYHDFLDAPGQGINLIDAGHFPTEDPVCRRVIAALQAEFPSLYVSKSASHREVIQYYVEGE
ncbi:MAG: Nif3-like dinuclear metal center hexameric protein [Oscillibacter sp.]|nr:Nif3-like dinuclear metal center hexameric protein [Oscillibacter sp.]